MAATYGYTMSIQSSHGAQSLLGGSDPKEGPIDVLVRANAPGVYLGGENLAGASSGYELVEGEEYRFVALLAQLRVLTTSVSAVTVSVLVQPHIR